MGSIAFVGMDVHKVTIAVAVAEGIRGGEVRQLGIFPNRAEVIAKLAQRLAADGRELSFCYEAGPCGYGTRCSALPSSTTSTRRPGSPTSSSASPTSRYTACTSCCPGIGSPPPPRPQPEPSICCSRPRVKQASYGRPRMVTRRCAH